MSGSRVAVPTHIRVPGKPFHTFLECFKAPACAAAGHRGWHGDVLQRTVLVFGDQRVFSVLREGDVVRQATVGRDVPDNLASWIDQTDVPLAILRAIEHAAAIEGEAGRPVQPPGHLRARHVREGLRLPPMTWR